VKLAAYYLVVSLAYAILYAVKPRVAEGALVAYVSLLLLVPAMYSEFLRIRRH
jgi:hypothetical protein